MKFKKERKGKKTREKKLSLFETYFQDLNVNVNVRQRNSAIDLRGYAKRGGY